MMQGERVILRPMEKFDTDDVVRMRQDRAVLAQLFSDNPSTRESHLQWFEKMQAEGTRQEFMIVNRVTNRSVGTIGLSNIVIEHHRAEFGILIGDAKILGKGLAFEASELLLDYAFNKLGLRRVCLHMFSDNKPARGLYQKLGFIQEGTLKQYVYKNGEYRDVVVMALLRNMT